jgi:hypothetical protein
VLIFDDSCDRSLLGIAALRVEAKVKSIRESPRERAPMQDVRVAMQPAASTEAPTVAPHRKLLAQRSDPEGDQLQVVEDIAYRTQQAAQAGRLSSKDKSLPDTAEFQLRMFTRVMESMRKVAAAAPKTSEAPEAAFDPVVWANGLPPLFSSYVRFVTKMLFNSAQFEDVKPFSDLLKKIEAAGS